MALVGIELETLVSEPDALTTRPPPFCKVTIKTYTGVALSRVFISFEAFQLLFIYMKLINLDKTSQLHFNLRAHKKEKKHKRALNIVLQNKNDSIQISCVVLGQFQS